jgi:DNA-binding CsgD family transcriptional regulator
MDAAADEDRKAVMRLIETESAAYLAKDYDTWAACWAHAPYVRRWVSTTRRGVNTWEGWERQGRPMKLFMEANPDPSTARYRREAINVRVANDMAWASFEQHTSGGSGPETDVPELNNELRILEKDADGWKIVCICSFQRSLDHIASAVVQVDPQGAVISMNAAAKTDMRASGRMFVRSGRLRAADRAADQRLQAAIRWAGYRDDTMWPRHGTLPVLLGGGNGDPVDVCWVAARSHQIYVFVKNQEMLEERLGAAAAIYGITPAQLRLAQLTIAGHDLRIAAKRLGVSVATTRTHMQRMFDKVGVHSQTALVRALLSVAAPLP